MIFGGVVWNSETDFKLRLGMKGNDIEAQTDKLFSESIVSFSSPYSCGDFKQSTWGSQEWDCVERKYLYFLTIQTVVEHAILQERAGDEIVMPTSDEELCQMKTVIVDQGMDFVPLIGDGDGVTFFQVIQLFLTPICTVFSFAFTVPLVLKRIVEEKQQGVKELMKMMGLPNWLHWVGWFTITVIISIITISIMVIVITVGEIFTNVNPLVLFISLFLYGFATICFNFAQSTLFSNRKYPTINHKILSIFL